MAGLLFQGLSGIVGGVGLVGDPTGGNVRIPVAWLEGSPFENYFIPGLILLLVLGVYPLIALYSVWTRRSWSWPVVMPVGPALIFWIGVQISIIGYHPWPPLQLFYGLLGVFLLVLTLLPSVRHSL